MPNREEARIRLENVDAPTAEVIADTLEDVGIRRDAIIKR